VLALIIENPIGPESPLSLWFLGGSVIVLGTTLAAGFKIVQVIRKELSAYVLQSTYDLQRKADEKLAEAERKNVMDIITHMHGCMHEIKAAVAVIQQRAIRKNEEERRERDDD